MSVFRWGILGSGAVAHKFSAGLAATRRRAVVAAVASRDPDNARRLAARWRARVDNFESLAAAGGVDAVYIATPPHLHEAHAVMCLEAGLPVLIEKPIAIDAAAARRIAGAARRAGRFAMEAMWTRFLPATAAIRAELAAGHIGVPRGFSGTFAIADAPSPGNGNFNAQTGGGALLHRGIYPLSLACHYLGPVTDIRGHLTIGDTGVDTDVMASARHTSGAISQIHASLVTEALNDATLYGSEGRIEIEAPIYRPGAFRLHRFAARDVTGPPASPGRLGRLKEHTLAHTGQQKIAGLRQMLPAGSKRTACLYTGNGYTHEADAAMEAIAAGLHEHPLMPLDESIHVMDAIDALRSSAGSVRS